MRLPNTFVLHLSRIVGAAVVVTCLIVPAAGQDDASQPKGVPDDWSHHHVIFSNPGTMQDAIRNGTYQNWLRVQTDPRFKMQQLKRKTVPLPQSEEVEQKAGLVVPPHGKLQRDWNLSLGAGGVAATMYPAKYSFSINNASCSDFVVFPANSAGVAPVAAHQTGTVSGTPTTAQGQTITITNGANNITLTGTPTVASATGTFTGEPATGGTVTITNGSDVLVLTAGASTSTSCTVSGSNSTGTFARSGTIGTNATNLNTLIGHTNCGSFVGVGSTVASDTVTITATASGSGGNSISLAKTLTTFTWASSTLTGGLNSMTSGTYFATSSTASTEAANIASAINANGSTVGVGATSASGTVTVTATTPGGDGNNITLAEAVSNFTWTGTTLAGGAGQGNLVGINNLYSGAGGLCGAIPTVLFSYEVGTGTVQTSPSLSDDGTKLAYVESITGGSKFHVLKIGTTGSNGTTAISPVEPGTGNNASDSAITMSSDVQVTLSSPYIDYGHDIAYVGDDTGKLHKFTGVFNGTPAEVTTGGWPFTVSSGNTMTGPVLDSASGNVFVGDSNGVLWAVSTTANCGAATPPCNATSVNVGAINGFATPGGRPLIDPVILDSSIEKLYAFISCGYSETGQQCSHSTTTPDAYAQVMQASNSLTGAVWASVGFASGTNNTHEGAFDNTYYSGSLANAHLYVCGEPSLQNTPILYQLNFNAAGTMSATPSATTRVLGSSAEECSPLTEIYNTTTSTDWLFLSVPDGCTATGGGTAGCAMNFELPDTATGFPGAPVAAAAESVGTGGIIIDNVSSQGQASSLYFGTLSGGANDAIKLTQSGLQ